MIVFSHELHIYVICLMVHRTCTKNSLFSVVKLITYYYFFELPLTTFMIFLRLEILVLKNLVLHGTFFLVKNEKFVL